MPTPTYIPLATKTLTATATSVTFSSISQAYRDLVLVAQMTGTGSMSARLQCNGDTGANYSWVTVMGDGSQVNNITNTGQTNAFLGLFLSLVTTASAISICNIFDYSATDKHKSMIGRASRAGGGAEMLANRYASLSAITSLRVYVDTSAFAIGSTFTLYGIAA